MSRKHQIVVGRRQWSRRSGRTSSLMTVPRVEAPGAGGRRPPHRPTPSRRSGRSGYPRCSGSPPASPAVGGRATAVRKPEDVTRGALDRGSRPPNGERSRRCSDRARPRVPPRRVDGMGMSAMWNVSPPNADLKRKTGVHPERGSPAAARNSTQACRIYTTVLPGVPGPSSYARAVSPEALAARRLPAQSDEDGLPIMGRRDKHEGDL
jgi:hypothetical protein